jgi:hypothetical protein
MADILAPARGQFQKRYIDMGDGSHAEVVVASAGGGLSTDAWAPGLTTDATLTNSNKLFTVPAATEWQLLSVLVDYTSTAAAGNRQLAVQVLDASDNVLLDVRAGAVQAASLTRRYVFTLGAPDDFGFRDTALLMVFLPLAILPAGYQVRVWDNKAIAAAADTMVVRMQYMARTV